jgi:hypothetical protein
MRRLLAMVVVGFGVLVGLPLALGFGRYRVVEEGDRFVVVSASAPPQSALDAGPAAPPRAIYRALPGRRLRGAVAVRDLGPIVGVAFLEELAGDGSCDLVLAVDHVDHPGADDEESVLRWRLGRCQPTLRPYWLGPRRVSVGSGPLKPAMVVSFELVELP